MNNLIKFIVLPVLFISCRSTKVDYIPQEELLYNPQGKGHAIEITFTRGKAHNHPLMAIWIEDEEGKFIQTLYVAESIGKGVFKRGEVSSGKWMPGEIRRPAALPSWSHRRGIKAKDGLFVPDTENPVPDAYTGPTPSGNFTLNVRADESNLRRFILYFEINQSWDWNEYWTNNKFPGDEDYKTSCQPALVYSTKIDMDNLQSGYVLNVSGHSHYSGKTGELFTDISTITTALDITKEIKVRILE